MSSLRTLMCVICNKASSLPRSDTQCGFLLVLWFDITHTQGHRAHLGGSRLTHPYKYIFTPTIMFSQQLSLLYWINNYWYQKFTFCFTFLLFCSKIIHLQKSYLFIGCYKIRFFLWNTNITERNDVNKQNTQSGERWHWKGLVSIKISATPLC